MNKNDKSLEEIREEDEIELIKNYQELRLKAKVAREKIMNGKFTPLLDSSNKAEIEKYIVQFVNIVPECVFFPDEDLIKKLKEYKFSRSVLKWFTPIDLVLSELLKFRNVEDSFFPISYYLDAINCLLITKIKCEIIESFDLGLRHGKKNESNIAYKALDNMFRRLEYHENKNQIAELDPLDSLLFLKMKPIKSRINDEVDFEKIVLSAMHGNFDFIKDFFSTYFAPNISKNEVYIKLFPLIKLVFKDVEMLTEDEFNNLPNLVYGGSYRKYQVSRVKKTLKIK